MFESFDALYLALEDVKAGYPARLEIDNSYYSLLENYETIEATLKADQMYKDDPFLIPVAWK